MKSGLRALIVSIGLFLLWGTIITGPFRYFANAFRVIFTKGADYVDTQTAVSGFLITILLIVTVSVLLILGAKKFSQYMAGLYALLSMAYYLFTSIQTQSFDMVSFTAAAGLSLALLFLIFQANAASLWLADAYVFSIPVLLFFELVLTPAFPASKPSSGFLYSFFKIPSEGLAERIGPLLQIPMLIWSLFLFALMLIPVLYLSRNRKNN